MGTGTILKILYIVSITAFMEIYKLQYEKPLNGLRGKLLKAGKAILLFGYLCLAVLTGHLVIDFFGIKNSANALALIEQSWLVAVFICLSMLDKKMYERKETFRHRFVRYLVQWLFAVAVFVWAVCGRLPLHYFFHRYATGAAVAGILLFVSFLYLNKNPKTRRIGFRDILLLLPMVFGCFFFGERIFTENAAVRLDYMVVNLVILFFMSWIILGVTGSWNVTIVIGAIVGMAWALVHYYVYQFRGEVFQPSDIFAARTAAAVADQYVFGFTKEIWWFGVFVLLCAVVAIVSRPVRFTGKRILWVLARAVTPVLVTVLVFRTDWLELVDYSIDVWDMKGMYDTLGYTFGFAETLRKSEVESPSGYSEDVIAGIAEKYKGNTVAAQTASVENPNIIVIMNETLADIGDVGTLDCKKDYMPYLHSCGGEENTVTGRTLVSVFGGHTCDSEYEFLTGNSLEYMSAIAPFATEINKDTYSLVSTLEAQGYHTMATHPNAAVNWRRDVVYQYFGFDESYFIDDYENPEFLRGACVSDRDVYHKILRLMKGSIRNQPEFMFAVTMQNHGGYSDSRLRPDQPLPIKEKSIGGTLSQFLSLMYESDQAFEELIESIDAWDEPTIVVMFGDHYPNLGDDIYNAIRGGVCQGLADTQTMYATPYVIHANYDVDLSDVAGYMSVNYLSANLLKVAGLETTAYQNYLLDMQETVPALNRNGYLTAAGEWREYTENDDSIEGQRIEEYNLLEYNARYQNASEAMFAISGE